MGIHALGFFIMRNVFQKVYTDYELSHSGVNWGEGGTEIVFSGKNQETRMLWYAKNDLCWVCICVLFDLHKYLVVLFLDWNRQNPFWYVWNIMWIYGDIISFLSATKVYSGWARVPSPPIPIPSKALTILLHRLLRKMGMLYCFRTIIYPDCYGSALKHIHCVS